MLIKNPGTPQEENLGSKIVGLLLKRGDVLRAMGAGGGGWGDPAKRDPALAERDRAEGYL